MRLHGRPRMIIAIATCGGLAVAGIASAASAGVPKSGAGDGNANVLDYTIASTPVYTLDADNPQRLAKVTFTLAPAPLATAKVRAQVLDPGGAWYTCSFTGAAVTCDTTAGTPASSLTANQLRVVVVD